MYPQLLEGQNFCGKNEKGSYFPLSIKIKKILWGNTYYYESIMGTKQINGKEYTEFKQEWKNKEVNTLYLREENGVVYQYEECCEQETIRFSTQFKKEYKWEDVDHSRLYKIISFKGKLKTPYCNYEDLLVIEAKMNSMVFNFYYLKGIGYVGATKNNDLISFITPED